MDKNRGGFAKVAKEALELFVGKAVNIDLSKYYALSPRKNNLSRMVLRKRRKNMNLI